MDILLLAASTVGTVVQNLVSRAGGASFVGLHRLGRTNLIANAFTFTVLLFFGFDFDVVKANPSLFLLFSALYGIFAVLAQTLFIMAVEKNSVAIATLILSSGFLIPTFFAVFFYGEKLSIFRLAGIALLIVCLFLVIDKPQKKMGGWRFLLLAVSAAICSGAVGILQRLYVSHYPAENGMNEFLLGSFSFMIIFAFLQWTLGERKTRHLLPKESSRYAFILPTLAIAVCTAIAHKLNLYLSSALPSTVFFPVNNVSSIGLTSIGAAFFFRERLSKRKTAGILLSAVAILIVSFG